MADAGTQTEAAAEASSSAVTNPAPSAATDCNDPVVQLVITLHCDDGKEEVMRA